MPFLHAARHAHRQMSVAHEGPYCILDTPDFFALVVDELKRAANYVSIDATLLETQLAREPGLDPTLREMTHDIRHQADLVSTLLDALTESSNETLT
jgi:hypothetical protein